MKSFPQKKSFRYTKAITSRVTPELFKRYRRVGDIGFDNAEIYKQKGDVGLIEVLIQHERNYHEYVTDISQEVLKHLLDQLSSDEDAGYIYREASALNPSIA